MSILGGALVPIVPIVLVGVALAIRDEKRLKKQICQIMRENAVGKVTTITRFELGEDVYLIITPLNSPSPSHRREWQVEFVNQTGARRYLYNQDRDTIASD